MKISYHDHFIIMLLNVNPKLSSYHRKHPGSNTPMREEPFQDKVPAGT
jgi:hypothetical protein